MRQIETVMAGLRCLVVSPDDGIATAIVVVLHGYAMQPEDLAPFAHSMNNPAIFYFPQAPIRAEPGGYTWWNIDTALRAQQLSVAARDLANEYPPGRPAARLQLCKFIDAAASHNPSLPRILVGFSQGGMLACDAILCGDPLQVAGLAMLSSSRIAIDEWQSRCDRLQKLPVLISHGLEDADLAFGAGEALRDFHIASGAAVSWAPFDGGHTIPLPIWRSVRGFIRSCSG